MNARAIAYPLSWRLAAAVLMVISRGSLPALLGLLLFFDTRLENPLRLMRVFTGLCLLPGIALWLLERAFAVTLRVSNDALVLEHRRRRIEIPCDAIEHVTPWTVPLPSGGVWLRLRSGRRFRYGLQVADSIALAEALAAAGAADTVRAASAHWIAVYTRSKSAVSRRWYYPFLKFVLFALLPALPLFRLHQWVAYGGTFGEYYIYGLQAYLLAFAIYWGTSTIYLVLYAAALRAAAETIALPAAYAAPRRAASVRRAVEIAHRALYYTGVPLFLLRLFLSQ